MFKKFRINHIGFHRLAIIVGVIAIPVVIFYINYEGFGWGGYYRYGIIAYYFGLWEYIFKYPKYMDVGLFFLIFHIISYLIGYFSVAILFWLKEGFKK